MKAGASKGLQKGRGIVKCRRKRGEPPHKASSVPGVEHRRTTSDSWPSWNWELCSKVDGPAKFDHYSELVERTKSALRPRARGIPVANSPLPLGTGVPKSMTTQSAWNDRFPPLPMDFPRLRLEHRLAVRAETAPDSGRRAVASFPRTRRLHPPPAPQLKSLVISGSSFRSTPR